MIDKLQLIQRVVDKYNKAYNALGEEVAKELGPAFEEIMEPYLHLKTISWPQYTPYFMDGDECIFSVNSWGVKLNGLDEDDVTNLEDEEDERITSTLRELGFTDIGFSAALEKVRDLLSAIPDDILRGLYGDHVLVTYTRGKGFTTEAYAHE